MNEVQALPLQNHNVEHHAHIDQIQPSALANIKIDNQANLSSTPKITSQQEIKDTAESKHLFSLLFPVQHPQSTSQPAYLTAIEEGTTSELAGKIQFKDGYSKTLPLGFNPKDNLADCLSQVLKGKYIAQITISNNKEICYLGSPINLKGGRPHYYKSRQARITADDNDLGVIAVTLAFRAIKASAKGMMYLATHTPKNSYEHLKQYIKSKPWDD